MIGEKIKKFREDLGLTQVEFAEKLNITQARLSSYETGIRHPPIDILAKIIEEMNIDANWLFGDDRYVPDMEEIGLPPEHIQQIEAIDKLGLSVTLPFEQKNKILDTDRGIDMKEEFLFHNDEVIASILRAMSKLNDPDPDEHNKKLDKLLKLLRTALEK